MTFGEVTKAELAGVKAQLRVQAREAEQAAERAADELRVRRVETTAAPQRSLCLTRTPPRR